MTAFEGHWVSRMFAAGDTLDIDQAMAVLSEDVVMRVCNNPPTHGKQAARASFEALVENFSKVEHELVNVYDVTDELTVTETFVRYTLKDGRVVTNFSCNHLRHKQGLVYDNRIFMDTTCFLPPAASDA